MYQDDDMGYIVEDDYNQDNGFNSEYSNNEVNDFEYEESKNNKKNNKIIYIVVLLIVLVLIFFIIKSCGKKGDVIPSINIIEDTINVKKDDNININIEMLNASNSNIFWSSNDENIAIVNESGTVKGISLGKTVVNASYTHSNYRKYSDKCNVIVYQGDLGVNLIDYTIDNQFRIKVGNTERININFNPFNAYIYSIVYKSNDESIASVDNSGNISGNRIGNTSVTIIVNDNIERIVNIEVYEQENIDDEIDNNTSVNVTSVSFDKDKIDMMVSQEKKLLYNVYPNNSKNYKVEFETSNDTVLKVDKNGNIKAYSIGTSIVTIRINNTITDTIVVNVKPYVIDVNQLVITSSTSLTLKKGATSTIKYNLLPDNASNNLVLFETSNESVATVDVNGVIKAVGSGTCVIKAKTEDGKKIVNINVKVN